MKEPIAYVHGKFVPAATAAVSIADAGFVLGATVSEQLRTFNGRIFRLPQHLARLRHSLEIVDVDPGLSNDELTEIAERVVKENRANLEDGDDLGLAILVTPGTYTNLVSIADHGPTVIVHTYPLAFHLWANKYIHGESLVTPDIRQVPNSCWPAALKCRSRMHYYLADRAAGKTSPGSRALLLDQNGNVSETATANIVLYRENEGLVAPPSDDVLPGISLAYARDLAAEQGWPYRERPLSVEDVIASDEVLVTSTPNCILPVTSLNGRVIGGGQPGRVFKQLLDAWSAAVGVNIAEQAARFAQRVGDRQERR